MSDPKQDSKCSKDDALTQLNEQLATFISGVSLSAETQAALVAVRALSGTWASRILQSKMAPTLKHDALRALLLAKDAMTHAFILPTVKAKEFAPVSESDSTMIEEFEEFMKKYEVESIARDMGMAQLKRASELIANEKS